jgi:hypothetical protein
MTVSKNNLRGLAASGFRFAKLSRHGNQKQLSGMVIKQVGEEGDKVVRNTLRSAGFESPSLLSERAGGGPAYELKFLLKESQARDVQTWAQRQLTLDPHGEPALGGAYQIRSLYCDTPELDVYYRSSAYKDCKFRVRRYGSSPFAYLERKSKAGDAVSKRRVAIPDAELVYLERRISPKSWPGHWFHRSLLAGRLQPACVLTYQRTAYFGWSREGPLRLTLDRRIHGVLTDTWDLATLKKGLLSLSGQVILELKFRSALPKLFQELVRQRGLSPNPISKYRLCREAWGVAQNHLDVVET